MKRTHRITTVIFTYALLIFSENLTAQIKWTDWREIEGQPNISYRIAFAKQDEANRLYGYYLEFRNQNNSRVKFSFGLSNHLPDTEKEKSVLLKPNMQSQVGIHYTDIAEESEVSVYIKSVQLEE